MYTTGFTDVKGFIVYDSSSKYLTAILTPNGLEKRAFFKDLLKRDSGSLVVKLPVERDKIRKRIVVVVVKRGIGEA